MEILRACDVVLRHQALDGGHNKLVAQPCLQLLQVVLEVRRGHNEYQRVISFHNAIDVAGEEYLVCVEVYAGKVIRIVTDALKLLYAAYDKYPLSSGFP